MSPKAQPIEGAPPEVSHALLDAICESPAQGVVAVNAAGIILFANRMVEEQFGYTRGELVGEPLSCLIPERLRIAHTQHFEDYRQQPTIRRMGVGREITGLRKDQSEIPVEVAISYGRSTNGDFVSVAFLSDISTRNEQNAALRASDARLARMSAAGQDGFWEWDLERQEIYVSDPWRIMLGEPPKSSVPPEKLTKWLGPLEEGAADRVSFEVSYRRSDGRLVWVWARAQVSLRNAAGRPALISGALTDITDRKAVEQLLHQTEARLQMTAATAHVGTGELDLATGQVVLGEEAYRIFGRAEGSLSKLEPLLATMATADAARIEALIFGTGEAGTTPHEVRILQPGGALRWVRWSQQVRPGAIDDTRSRARVIVALQDITEAKALETAFRWHEAQLRIAVESAELGTWSVDLESGHIEASPQARTLLGLDGDAPLHPDDLWRVLHPADQAAVRHALVREMAANSPLVLECRVLGAEASPGAFRWLRLQGRFVGNLGSHRGRIFGILQDVTPHKRYEERLRTLAGQLLTAQEEERRRIAREIHDGITQDLALAGIELGLLRRESAAESARQKIAQVEEKLLAITEDLRLLSHEFHPGLLEHAGLRVALEAHCRELSSLYGLEVRLEAGPFADKIPRGLALPLYRIAQESLRNVVKHAHASQALVSLREIEDAAGGRRLHLSVVDDGIGFEPGSPEQGTGLGIMSIAERARLIGGELQIHSVPQAGTRLQLTVPLPDAPEVTS